jgi:hypothetical protein
MNSIRYACLITTDSALRVAGPWKTASTLLPSGIEKKRGVVARVILTLAWRAIVASACRETCLVESMHHLAIARLKREMNVSGRRCGLAVDEELIEKEEPASIDESVRLTERFRNRFVEAFAALEVVAVKMDVV